MSENRTYRNPPAMYEAEALDHLDRARTFREELADAYVKRPLDHNLVGALRMGVKFELETAQVFATLAAADPSKLAIESAMAQLDRERRQLGLAPMAARP